MSKSVTNKKKEVVIKNLLRKKSQVALCLNSIKYFKEELQSFLNFSKKKKLEGNSFYKDIIIIYLNQRVITRTENYRPIFLVNRCGNSSVKCQQTKFKNTSKRLHSKTRWDLSQMQSLFNICKSTNAIHRTNRIKYKNHLIISTDAEKGFDKVQIHSS